MSGPAGRSDLIGEVAARVGSRREAVWIVEHAEGATPRKDGPAGSAARALVLAERRANGEPLQYVLGTWPFRTLELEVDRRVLIPRPETEQLVDAALLELDRVALGRHPGEPVVCVDLGTGSGAIALSLASEGSGARALEIWATDVSEDALTVARANRERLARRDPAAAAGVTLAAGDWFGALPDRLAGAVDLVVSNPPYVSEEEYSGLEETVRGYEPRGALVAGPGAVRSARDGRRRGGPRRVGAVVAALRGPGCRARAVAGLRRVGRCTSGRLHPVRHPARPGGSAADARGGALTVPVTLTATESGSLHRAAEALAGGAVVAVPTDTVYGLAVDPMQPDAVDLLFRLKGRPPDVPLAILAAGREQVDMVAGRMGAAAEALAERFWPGPLTLVVPRRSSFTADLGGSTSARQTVGVRRPDHPVVVALCRMLGPLAVTSANLHGRPPATTAEAVGAAWAGADQPAVILDGGTCDGVPSSVVECSGVAMVCLREGGLPWSTITGAPTTGTPLQP